MSDAHPSPAYPEGIDDLPKEQRDAAHAAWCVAYAAWKHAKKQRGGIHFKYGRFGQFEFHWDDKKDQDGKFLCRGCGGPINAPRRKYYCGAECDRDWHRRFISPTRWNHWRRKALQRDGDRCVLCHDGPMSPADLRDAKAVERADEDIRLKRTTEWRGDEKEPTVLSMWRHRDFLVERQRGRQLEVDHIKPVARYPQLEFTLENLRVLCHKCHAQHGARPQPYRRSQNHRLELA